ncbi:MAG TPA: M56 family peptidase [Gordonia polyisoprenivorans]|uniref:M56 family metallopeptidase n=1 Tax=Gordonia polyisoprenivorans TaxID=84595 RepID=A0A846WT63_9ACTN|nr:MULTISPECIES: M56 family metallopeptidase [Gordonia]MDF3283313.1 M56 family metallopeptidase [Gordonia sp. N1V]NKY04136.1 M56 family metallopeptidase [Gordonia polyisoprenivorans]OPX15083.1 Zn-dependent protease with chaperone function [Gordonia sp. i37]OZC30714.1 Zn-dependent protease with chaperone function [Gordonia polyisoprenivorans]QUD84883.1 M56 family metallopeptidase [Gordonia polyisoprenivorans]
MTALLFGILTLLLVGPVPEALSRAAWPIRAPRAAMTLWQAIALAAVLSAFSCGLAIAANLLAPGADGTPTTHPLHEIERLGIPLWSIYISVFALTLLIGARLLFTVIRVGVRTRARRANHRQLIDILDACDRSDHTHPLFARDIRMLDVSEPLAYCLPGLRQRVVLSEGVVSRLTRDELIAVIAHERAHLRARHDLVLEAFIALHEAFPRFVRSSSALDAVKLLVEALADDQAVRATAPTTLGRALVACADAVAPRGAMAVGGPTTLARVNRLCHDRPTPLLALAAYATAVAILVVPTLAVAIPWLTEISRLLTAHH